MKILKDLCSLIGVSGYELKLTEYIKSEVIKNNKCSEIFNDQIGNFICKKLGTTGNKNIVISAHIDEVGFQVLKKINGIYKIKTLGNIKTWNAVNQQVKSEKSTGIIYAENYEDLKANDFTKLYLFPLNGLRDIKIGSVFTFDIPFIEGEKFFCGKSLDNRVSVFCLLKLISSDIQSCENIFYAFTVQEETTMRGYRVVKSKIKPDLHIVLDTSPENESNSVKTGGGVAIKISDSLGISSPEYVDFAINIAKKHKIKYQLEVSNCGTSELILGNEIDFGGNELGISIPCKNIHSANSLVNKQDLTETIKFMKALISEL